MRNLLQTSAVTSAATSLPTSSLTQPPVDDTVRLRSALTAAANQEEREQAASALGHALAGLLQAPQADDPPEVWLVAICLVADKSLALAWLAALEGDAWLGEAAILGRISEVRLAAIQRVEDSAVLEHVAQLSRDKDKRVYRSCSDRLRARRQADEDAHRAEAVAAALRGLLDVAPIHLSHMLDLERELSSLGGGSQAFAECKALLDQAHARLQQESLAQRDLQTRKALAEQLRNDCANVQWPEPAQLDEWRASLETLRHAQAGLPSWLSSQSPSRKLDELLHDLHGRFALLGAEGENIAACAAFLENLAAGRPSDEASATAAAAAWAALEKPKNPVARQDLESRWLALHKPAKSVSPAAHREAAAVNIDLAAVRHLLTQLENALEQGHLADAEALARALDAAIGASRLAGTMESRLQRAHGQLGKLRGWAEWSAGQARETLINAAEQLLIGSPSVDDLAQGVKALREEWKRLNAHGVKSQWLRFDAALKKAYLPVAARQAEEAARQAAAREVKLALCLEWESYCASIVWENIDCKVLENDRLEMLRRWRAAAQAGFRDERMLHKRLDKQLKAIDQRLEAMRNSEVLRREQLISEAQALRDLSDLGRAITQVKTLQGQWASQANSLRLNRRDEQSLWQRFRAACDEVFARRDEQRALQVVQRKEGTQAIRSLLDVFAASLAVNEANLIRQSLNQFRADWRTAKANSREWADAQEARARDLQQHAQQRIEQLLQDKHRTKFDLLEKKAAIAEGVEAAAVSAEHRPANLDAALLTWEALPRLPGKSESLLAQRLARASRVTAGDLTSGRETREVILLDLEIALGLPSPDANARRRRQLEHLQTRFGAAAQQPDDAEALFVRWHATAAAADAALERRMAAVKQRLLEQTDRQVAPGTSVP